MSMLSPMLLLVAAIGADIKAIRTNSSTLAINAATRLIQTQKIMAEMVSRGEVQ